MKGVALIVIFVVQRRCLDLIRRFGWLYLLLAIPATYAIVLVRREQKAAVHDLSRLPCHRDPLRLDPLHRPTSRSRCVGVLGLYPTPNTQPHLISEAREAVRRRVFRGYLIAAHLPPVIVGDHRLAAGAGWSSVSRTRSPDQYALRVAFDEATLRGTHLAVISMSAQPPAELASVAGEAAARHLDLRGGLQITVQARLWLVRAAISGCSCAPPCPGYPYG